MLECEEAYCEREKEKKHSFFDEHRERE